MAFANRVFPVPGGPWRSTPFGNWPPSLLNFSGSFRKRTTSLSSSLASEIPATSSKVTVLFFSGVRRELFSFEDLDWPDLDLVKSAQPPKISMMGIRDCIQLLLPPGPGSALISTFFSRRCGMREPISGEKVLKVWSLESAKCICPPLSLTFLIFPFWRWSKNLVYDQAGGVVSCK